ncbi:RNA-binding S4 domain-containing protein [Peptoniphilaceae bacterium SGI.131]
MRIDKFLKNSRLIKRRTVAKEACDFGRVSVNGKVIKAGYDVKEHDIIEIRFGEKTSKIEVLELKETSFKDQASQMFKILEE